MSGVARSRVASSLETSPEESRRSQNASLSSRTTWYTVRAGDTLAKIAARFNTTVEKLKSWNHLTSNRVTVGRKLVVSPTPVRAAARNAKKVIHQVKQGETLDPIPPTSTPSIHAILSCTETHTP